MHVDYMCDHLTSPRRPVSRMSRISRDLIEAPYQATSACILGFWGFFHFSHMQNMSDDLGTKGNIIRDVQESTKSIFLWFKVHPGLLYSKKTAKNTIKVGFKWYFSQRKYNHIPAWVVQTMDLNMLPISTMSTMVPTLPMLPMLPMWPMWPILQQALAGSGPLLCMADTSPCVRQ